MELWRRTFRVGFAPLISTAGLRALAEALATDNPKLIQGATVVPISPWEDHEPAGRWPDEWPAGSACAIGFCAWKGEDLKAVEEVQARFGLLCVRADERLGEAVAGRFFLNWFDETPRDEAFPLLLAEVRAVLAEREG